MRPLLTGSNLSTYNAIFQHPLPRDLRWPDVHAVLADLATVVKADDGSLHVSRHGQKLFLQRPQRNVATAQEVMNVRRFLENSESVESAPPG